MADVDTSLVEIFQELEVKGGLWVCKVRLTLAGRAREGVGWGSSPEEARRAAMEEALQLTPEADPLLSPLLRKEGGKSEPPSPPEKLSGENGKEKGAGPEELFRGLARALKRANPTAFYALLEALGWDEAQLLKYATPKAAEEVSVARALYGAMRDLYENGKESVETVLKRRGLR